MNRRRPVPRWNRNQPSGSTFVALLFGLELVAFSSAAAQSSLGFVTYSPSDGLPQFSAAALTVDVRGVLWVGTQGGVASFDGKAFRTAQSSGEEPRSEWFVRDLASNSRGDLWAATNASGILRWSLGRPYPHSVTTATEQTTGASIDQVFAVVPVGDSAVVAGTQSGARSFVGSGSPVDLLESQFQGESPPCRAVARGSQTTVLIGCSNGAVFVLDATRPARPNITRSLDASAEVLSLLASGDTILVGTAQGVLRFDPGSSVGEAVPLAMGVDTGRSATEAHALLRDKGGTLWIGTRQGLVEVAVSGDVRRHMHRPGDPRSLPHNYVLSLLEDHSGNLWVGTWGGLAMATRYREAVRAVEIDDPPGQRVEARVVGMAARSGGGIWAGTLGGRLYSVSPQERMIHHAVLETTWRTDADIYSIEEDEKSDVLWVATAGEGFFERSGSGPFSPVDGLTSHNAIAVLQDSRGRVWVGTNGGAGLHELREGKAVAADAPPGLFEREIWPIREDESGRLVFGSFGPRGGVHRLDVVTGDSWEMTYDPDAPGPGLTSGSVLTVLPDPDGSIWVGTSTGGVTRVWPDLDRTEHLTTLHGLPSNAVQSLLLDDSDRLWAGTANGLAIIDRRSHRIRVLTPATGLASTVFHANSSVRTDDGLLWFGGPGGLTVIDPSKLPPPSPPPPIVLTNFSIFGEDQPAARWMDTDEPLILEHDENFFTFEFAALDYVDPEYNRYRYKLEGLDRDWIEAGNESAANYTSVPADDYVFVVSAANSEGVWKQRGLEIPIRVLPAFYETWWFRLLMAIVVLAFIAALYQYRMMQLRRVSAMRVRIAGRLHNEIGANLASIRARSATLDSTSSPAPDPGIGRLAEDTITKVREMLWVVKEEHDTVSGLIAQVENATDTILGGVVDYDFSATPPPDGGQAVPMELREDLYSLTCEALQNVVKHAEASHVDVEVIFEGRYLVVRVADDGIGFEPESVEAREGLAQLKSGFGNHRLRVDIRSRTGDGATVEIRVTL